MDGDRDAIARCQQGDVEGLAALIRRYEASALRLAYLLTGDRFLAEDIVQPQSRHNVTAPSNTHGDCDVHASERRGQA